MKANLIKDEENLDDLHPKKNVIRPKKKYRDYSLLNVNSKKFKIKDGKKNRIIRQKPLKFTSIRPKEDLVTESSEGEDYEHSAEEPIYFFHDPMVPGSDLDTESSDDDNKRIAKKPVEFFYDEAMPGWDSEDSDDSIPEHFEISEDFEVSEDFDKEEVDFDEEEPASTKKAYMVTSHASLVSAILLGTGEEPKTDSDYKMGVQVKPTLFEPDDDESDDDEPKMVSDYEIGVQVKPTVRALKTYVRRKKGKQAK